MRNKHTLPTEVHKEVKRSCFLQAIDKKTAVSFVSIARTELLKAKARSYLPNLPKEDGFTFIPNEFIEQLASENISASQFKEVLSVFRQGS